LISTGSGSLTFSSSTSGGSGQALFVADGSVASASVSDTVGVLNPGVLTVAMDQLPQSLADSGDARLQDAIDSLDLDLLPFGVRLVAVSGDLSDTANVHVHFSDTSLIGGQSSGVLGVTVDKDITLILGWNWYLGSDELQISQGQFDFQTVITHELGHAVGLGHSLDHDSVMYRALGDAEVRRHLAPSDLQQFETADGDGQPEALLASIGVVSVSLTVTNQVTSKGTENLEGCGGIVAAADGITDQSLAFHGVSDKAVESSTNLENQFHTSKTAGTVVTGNALDRLSNSVFDVQ
jgi:hypothetical protein